MNKLKISLLDIAGFKAAFKAMRFPKRSNEKSDSDWDYYKINLHPEIASKMYNISYGIYQYGYLGPNDLKLSQNLIQAGDEHAKHMRGIMVWLEITGPLYWWTEFVTYTIGNTALPSTSSMHVDCKGLEGEELQKAKGNIRGDYEYSRVHVINYQALRHIYFQRRYHRLPEWKQFCGFIETLPLAKELICIE